MSDEEEATCSVGGEEEEAATCSVGGEEEELEEPERPSAWTSGWDDESNDVEADPDPHATPEREILWACENGKQSVVEEILKEHPEAVGATDSDGYTPLHRAAYSDFPDIVKVCEYPKVYLLDTPGVMFPKIKDMVTGLKLALAATIKDHLVGEDIIADYLLYWLNSCGNHSYVEHLGLSEPTDNIQHLLLTAAARNNWLRKARDHTGVQTIPDVIQCAAKFIRAFREGKYGPVMLDDLSDIEEQQVIK
ncbi:mitochondrial GTPase 1 isoform X2 [Cherax quadricarinatus]|uniref:mitochondrial GTPase 1 isoform X2 n=1 Tax=Cherax quadricarinatus TaxID=27406 RepID=UPI00387E52A2